MARLLSDCTSAILFVLLGLAASIMLVTSAPTAQSVQETSARNLNGGLDYSVSYCTP